MIQVYKMCVVTLLAAVLFFPSCDNDKYTLVNPQEDTEAAVPVGEIEEFVHPGILHDADDLARIKQIVDEEKQPGMGSYLLLRAQAAASANYTVRGPFERIARDGVDGNTKIAFEQDFNAAYYNALMWVITADEAHAEKSIEIINAYSHTLKEITGTNDNALLAGLSGFPFVNAAEIMRYTYDKWGAADIDKCEEMLKNVFVKELSAFFGAEAYTNGNWGAAATKTMMALGVFLDDTDIFNNAVRFFYIGRDNGTLRNYIVTEEGQAQESGRDQPHTMLGIGSLAESCEIGWKQGLDMYESLDNRLLAGFEYTASYNLGNSVPYIQWSDITGKYSNWGSISTIGRGAFRPIFEIAYNAYAVRKQLSMPFTEQVLDEIRPEGPSPYNDNPGFGTLLFYSGD